MNGLCSQVPTSWVVRGNQIVNLLVAGPLDGRQDSSKHVADVPAWTLAERLDVGVEHAVLIY
jgi:hypothetical protein